MNLRRLALIISMLCSSGALWGQRVDPEPLTARDRMLLDRIDLLEKRLAGLEAKLNPEPKAVANIVAPQPAPAEADITPPALITGTTSNGTTLNANFDGYYGYNFNRPLG